MSRVDFGGLKPKQVFEILVLERGGPIAKDRLADLLWAEGLPRDHVATLATYVSVLRHRLQPKVGVRESVVRTESGAYSVDMDQIDLDLDQFDCLVRASRLVEPAQALPLLLEATDLACGEVLADERYVEWVLPIRNVYRRRVVDALNRAADLSVALGDALPAIELCERAILLDAANEESYQLLIRAAGALGRRSLAAATYTRCQEALRCELGVAPLDATRVLLADALAGDAGTAPVRTGPPRPRVLAPLAVATAS